MYLVAVMLSSYIDCKTVGFFLKISKEIGKAWRKSLARAKGASLTRLFSASFHTFCLTTRAYLNTQKYGPCYKARAFYIMHSLFNFFCFLILTLDLWCPNLAYNIQILSSKVILISPVGCFSSLTQLQIEIKKEKGNS